MQEPGELIDGRFRLERSVGSGGMGIVYLATDEQTNRQVAVKVLRAAVVQSIEARLRLSREIEVLSRLRSPYIAELYSTGYLPDHSPYFVMEYLEGRDLKAELRRRGPLPTAEVAAYLVQACRGMAVAHQHGIVHRDLKPHNLIVTNLDGVRQVKIVDFGIAKILTAADQGLTASDMAVGTPLYMCPEQLLEPRVTSTRADVWALGVILYELLAGFSPFADESPGAVVAAVTLDEPAPIRSVRPGIPEELAQLIDLALKKVPARRLASVEEFEQRLLPLATALDQLIVQNDPDARSEVIIERPPRVRGDVDLRREIRNSVDAGSRSETDTLRRVRARSDDAVSDPAACMKRIPSIRCHSNRPTLSDLPSSEPPRARRSGSDTLTWLVELAQNRTTRAATLVGLGLVVALVALSRWQLQRESSRYEMMHAPSRPVPTPLVAVAYAHSASSGVALADASVVTPVVPIAAPSMHDPGAPRHSAVGKPNSPMPTPPEASGLKRAARVRTPVPASTPSEVTVPLHL